MMRQLLLCATLGIAMISAGCTPPSVAGRTWTRVVDAEEVGGRGQGLTLVLPGERGTDTPGERVDPEQFLIAGVQYDACTHSSPMLVGAGDDRIEVQLTELNRMCVRPMPRVAWFSIPWSELPAALVLVDQDATEIRLQDRRRV